MFEWEPGGGAQVLVIIGLVVVGLVVLEWRRPGTLRKVARRRDQKPYRHGMGRGQAPRSTLLGHWGEKHIYPLRSQMAKVQRRNRPKRVQSNLWTPYFRPPKQRNGAAVTRFIGF